MTFLFEFVINTRFSLIVPPDGDDVLFFRLQSSRLFGLQCAASGQT